MFWGILRFCVPEIPVGEESWKNVLDLEYGCLKYGDVTSLWVVPTWRVGEFQL